MRPEPLLKLLQSVKKQNLYPDEILIIDGSTNDLTKIMLQNHKFQRLKYYAVTENDRGLTKQRNYGISRVNQASEVVCFLDDDTELYDDYFEALIKTFKSNKTITGVGGVAVNENKWFKNQDKTHFSKHRYYQLDNYVLKEDLRNICRNYLGLQSNLRPGLMSDFSNVRSSSYPLNDKIYEVDLLIGMSFAFRKIVVDNLKFSHYFEGYGLYEDADYSIRALKFGSNVINTRVKLNHYHNPSGRPNKFKYGKMVIRNGWYVWRIKYNSPTLKARFKWNATAFLLTIIRATNIVTTSKRQEALTETLGRIYGWFSLLGNKPKIIK